MTGRQQVLLTDKGTLQRDWPYTRARFEQRLADTADITFADVQETDLATLDWESFDAVALLGGELDATILARAPRLAVVGGMTDVRGPSCFQLLCARNIPFIDGTPAWAQSVVECGFGLILSALRRLPHWHRSLANGSCDWKYAYGQFCDDPAFVNGSLASKTVGVVGMGQIGSRLATWCTTIGAQVLAHDPFAPVSRFTDAGATAHDLDALLDAVDVLVVAVPPTPSADRMINAERIARLRKGAIVATMTRTAALDVDALRTRVLANEIFWTTDVYDTEPLPANDPILGRGNVVHLPHIAGRTRDSNICLADILADDFIRVFAGDPPRHALTPEAVNVRTNIEPG